MSPENGGNLKERMDAIYRNVPPGDIPWNRDSPPAILRALVETSAIRPCRAIELGCGAGNYVIYLAGCGFDATGVDISSAAIEIARKSALEKGATCRFVVADVLGDLADLRQPFDFAYDWELLHHIFPPDRERYVQNVSRLLGRGGRYLSVCFSEESAQFGGTGKSRRTSLDTLLYFSSESEMVSLFETLFVIDDLRTLDVEGKVAPHRAICAFMTKRG